MNDVESRLVAEYESALATADAPPCAVDVELARVHGRRLRRRHTAVVAGSGALGVVISVLLVIGLLPGGGFGHGSTGTTSGSADYSGPSVPPADDPLATRVSFGWLPDGVSVAGVTTQYPNIGDVTAGGRGMRFTVSVLPRGQHWAGNCGSSTTIVMMPSTASGPGAHKTTLPGPMCDPPAPAVNGRTAYWVIAPGDPTAIIGGDEMRWQYADDAWADLDAVLPTGMTSAAVSDLLHRIAQNVHVTRFQAMPMPFHLGRVPAGWHFEFADWSAGPQGRQASAGGGGEAGAFLDIGVGTTGPGSGSLQIWENPVGTKFPTDAQLKSIVITTPPGHTKTLTVDGHQARIVTDPDHTVLMVHDVNGLDVVVEAIEPEALLLAGSDTGIVAYYHTIDFAAADRATWTTHVLG